MKQIKLALNSNFSNPKKDVLKKHGVKITVSRDLTPVITGTLQNIKNYVLECNENDHKELFHIFYYLNEMESEISFT